MKTTPNLRHDSTSTIKHASSSAADRPLRLLIVGIKWPPETFIQRRLQSLSKHGIDVTVANSLPQNRASYKLKGVKHVILPRCQRLSGASIFQLMQSVYRLASCKELHLATITNALVGHIKTPSKLALNRLQDYLALASIKTDIVHFEWISSAIAYAPLFSGLEVPIVISCRGSQVNVEPLNPDKSLLAQNMRRVFQQATAIHCVSDAIRDQAVRYGLIEERTRVIRPAVDPKFFRPGHQVRMADKPFVVLMIGSLVWQKGYEYAISALGLLISLGHNISMKIIGDGTERQRILYTIFDLGLEKNVQLLGQQEPEQVLLYLQSADVFLLSSVSEGISNSVLEAMACGLPVVTTDCGGMREAVTDGVEGYVVPVRDPSAITTALLCLINDHDLRIRMGSYARNRILRDFTLDQQTSAFVEMYHDIMKKKLIQ